MCWSSTMGDGPPAFCHPDHRFTADGAADSNRLPSPGTAVCRRGSPSEVMSVRGVGQRAATAARAAATGIGLLPLPGNHGDGIDANTRVSLLCSLSSLSPGSRDAARFHHPGDLGRQLPIGPVMFCGRIDNPVKGRGQRIESPEVPLVLETHPAVASEVIVFRTRPGRANGSPCSYIVPRPGAPELEAHLPRKPSRRSGRWYWAPTRRGWDRPVTSISWVATH